jgi:hypothetical protein
MVFGELLKGSMPTPCKSTPWGAFGLLFVDATDRSLIVINKKNEVDARQLPRAA